MNALVGVDATFDHVAIAGPNLLPLLTFYRDTLGGTFSHGEVLSVGAVVVTLLIPGGKLELMAPTPDSCFLDKFLEGSAGRGGVHHLTFTVPDLAAAVSVLTTSGVALFGESYDEHWSEVFVHPRHNGGVLLQLAQVGPQLMDHVNRDLDVLVAAAL